MMKNSSNVHIPIFVYHEDDNSMSKICLTSFFDIDSFSYIHIPIPSYSPNQRNFAISTIDAKLITTCDRFNQFIELIGSLFTSLL